MAQVHVSNSEDNNSGQLSTEEMLFSIEMVEDGVEIVEYNGIIIIYSSFGFRLRG